MACSRFGSFDDGAVVERFIYLKIRLNSIMPEIRWSIVVDSDGILTGMAVRKRDHLLAVAQRMFCETGFHAVSVDAILAEAGVARMTLYKNFGSKEDLIVATLKREDRMFRQWLVSAVEAQSNHSEDRILGSLPCSA